MCASLSEPGGSPNSLTLLYLSSWLSGPDRAAHHDVTAGDRSCEERYGRHPAGCREYCVTSGTMNLIGDETSLWLVSL